MLGFMVLGKQHPHILISGKAGPLRLGVYSASPALLKWGLLGEQRQGGRLASRVGAVD
jgi:hypothetical protein